MHRSETDPPQPCRRGEGDQPLWPQPQKSQHRTAAPRWAQLCTGSADMLSAPVERPCRCMTAHPSAPGARASEPAALRHHKAGCVSCPHPAHTSSIGHEKGKAAGPLRSCLHEQSAADSEVLAPWPAFPAPHRRPLPPHLPLHDRISQRPRRAGLRARSTPPSQSGLRFMSPPRPHVQHRPRKREGRRAATELPA